MDLQTEAKPRFLNHEEPSAWFLADLDNGTVIQLSQTAKPIKITFIAVTSALQTIVRGI